MTLEIYEYKNVLKTTVQKYYFFPLKRHLDNLFCYFEKNLLT